MVFPTAMDCQIFMLSTTWALPMVAAMPPPPMLGLLLKVWALPFTWFSATVQASMDR